MMEDFQKIRDIKEIRGIPIIKSATIFLNFCIDFCIINATLSVLITKWMS